MSAKPPQIDEVERIKREIGVYDLALASGVKLRKIGGQEYEGLCPFHNDAKPSLHINPSKNLFQCKGCGREGSPIDWVGHERSVSVGEAIRILKAKLPAIFPLAENKTYKNGGTMKNRDDEQKELGGTMKNGNNEHERDNNNDEAAGAAARKASKDPGGGDNKSAAPGVRAPDTAESNSVVAIRLDPEHQKALRLYIEYCHRDLKAQQVPVDYLVQKRHITQGELIDQHLVGWVSGSAAAKLSGDKEIARALLKLGILKPGDDGKLVERFVGCLLFPSITASGVITDITARRVTGQGRAHDFLPGGHLGFWNQKIVGVAKQIIVTESPIDALSLIGLGFPGVISAFGAGGVTETIIQRILESGTKVLYVALDNDLAGGRGTEILVRKFKNLFSDRELPFGFEIRRVLFPTSEEIPVKDANDFIRKTPDAARVFKDTLLINSLLLYSSSAEKAKESAMVRQAHQPAENFKHTKTSDGEAFDFGSRKYLVRGLEDAKNIAVLKVFLRVTRESLFHNDNLDLYTAKSVEYFTRKAAEKLGFDERILRTDLDTLTLRLEEMRKNMQQKNSLGTDNNPQAFHRNLRMDKLANEFLDDPLLDLRFIEACSQSGVVGEPIVASICWEATLTRYGEKPLHILIQSESSSGKSTIQLLVKDYTPNELLHFFTELSENTLYYQADDAFWQVVIFIAEAEGLEKTRFAIKQMMSDGILSKGSVQQDPKSGEYSSIKKESRIRAPFLITLPKELEDEEFLNRCLCLTLDESREQTERIQEMQRKLYGPEGVKIRAARKYWSELFQHVQRMLEPLPVLNPYAEYFLVGNTGSFGRRDLPKILSLCEAITRLHQRHRERVNSGGVLHLRTHLIDIALLYFKAKRAFPATLDSLPPQARKFFNAVLFYMKEISERDNIDIMSVEVYRKHAAQRTGKAQQRVAELMGLLERYEYFLSVRDRQGLRYRLQFRPEEDGTIASRLALPPFSEIKKRAPKKERDELEAFVPQLKQIFKALDPSYEDGEY